MQTVRAQRNVALYSEPMEKTESRRPRRADAIFDAALSLLIERGYDALTMEGVAARSGVNKTTLYRWWPSKDALLAAALLEHDALELSVPDTGSLRGDLRALAGRITELLTDPTTAPIARTLLAAGGERPELATVSRAFFGDRLTREQSMLARASHRGEVVADIDLRTVMDLIAGSIWFRIFVRGETPTDVDLDEIIRAVSSGVGAAAEPAG